MAQVLQALRALYSSIGGGDVAFDYAMSLAIRGVSVTILVRGDGPKCNRELLGKVEEKSDLIRIVMSANVKRVTCRKDSCAVTYSTGENQEQLEVEHLLCATGRLPALNFLGESVTDRLEELTREERLFFIGDVGRGSFRQAAIAVGDGVRAAMKIGTLLESDGEKLVDGGMLNEGNV